MAMLKQKKLNNGVVGEYWKITSLILNKVSMKLRCELDLYVSSVYKDQSPIASEKYIYAFPVTADEVIGDLIELCYVKIKESKPAYLIGATDV